MPHNTFAAPEPGLLPFSCADGSVVCYSRAKLTTRADGSFGERCCSGDMNLSKRFPMPRSGERSRYTFRINQTGYTMNWREILSRLRGFSIMGTGASWEGPVKAERDIAHRVVTFFEDRRVLYNPYHLEVPEHCVESVHEMRSFLTEELTDHREHEGISKNLRAMRAACRKFLDTVQKSGGVIIIDDPFEGGPDAWEFFSALGELRATVGLHLSIIAANHKIDIHGDLEKIVPPEDE